MTTALFYYLLFSLGLADVNRNVNHFQFNYLDNYLGSLELECAAENILGPCGYQPKD